MAIVSSEIVFRFTVTTGAGGDAAAGTAAGSLGKYLSTTAITDASLNNLFTDITGDQNATSQVDYSCMGIKNTNGSSLTLSNVKCWLSAEVAGGASTAISLDSAGVVTSTTAISTLIASSTTTPSTASGFSSPTVKASGLAPANLPAGSAFAIWVRRTAANTAAVNSDGVTIRVEGDTPA